MANQERVRAVFAAPPDPAYLRQREAAGWRMAAVEWVRETEAVEEVPLPREDPPYGLRVAPDCLHLEENPAEKEAMMLMLEMIIQEIRLPQVAAELNQRGFRTRLGTPWSPVAIFNLLPRLIEIGPRIFSSREWIVRRPRLSHAG